MFRRSTFCCCSSATVLLLLVACEPAIIDRDTTVGEFKLVIDQHEALVAQACVDTYGIQGCAPYPNPLGCERLDISVTANGGQHLTCMAKGRIVHAGPASLDNGAPFICKASKDLHCQVCYDIYGSLVLDSCSRGAALYRSTDTRWGQIPGLGGAQVTPGMPGVPLDPNMTSGGPGEDVQPPNDGVQTAPGPQDTGTSPAPNPGTTTVPTHCSPDASMMNYASAINAVLQQEQINMTWSPSMSPQLNNKQGFWGFNGANAPNICSQQFSNKMTSCWSNEPGRCFCQTNGMGEQCRCSRITISAVRQACKQIPADCTNKGEHEAALAAAHGAATAWLFSNTYDKSSSALGFLGSLLGFGSGNPVGDKSKPQCLGSPLVLDLAGDGVAPSSPQAGVKFDLMGIGELQTAWVRGDDALLVLDRDGNGKIEGGAELFGEATLVDGMPADNGFAALAVLDREASGGNADGVVDQRDALFERLLLWRDANNDGQSQAGELSSLLDAGVTGIQLGVVFSGPRPDRHGNDLGLRGRFLRADGSTGLAVDVLFATR